ncbi:AAA family ATPase [Natrialbaceae archaeon A-CW2]|uniref:AAA family ATPase n=1 Tax=Natronosalvus amylolyticus TaxID=2961994 RepID=UPI0020C9F3E7|nr:AAA family ATPase [Natronosalvus amylolyticus]
MKAHAKGGAAVSAETLATLALSTNDLVSVTADGDQYAFARVTEAETGDGALPGIALDIYHCNQLGVGPGDRVKVQPATLPEARKISVRIPEVLYFQGRSTEIEQLVRSRLRHRPVGENHPVMINLELENADVGQHLPVRPTDVHPTGPAVVTNETRIEFDQELYFWRPTDQQTPETVGYDEIGGLSDELEQLQEMVELPFEHPELFDRLNIDPPTGVLLHGPPGTGKTLLAGAIADELDAHFAHIDGPEIIDKHVGVAQETLRGIFEQAREESPAVLFIDEIDAITPKRDGNSRMHLDDERLVTQLLTLMDGLDTTDDLVVIGATNRVDSIDHALRRGGRFDREIHVGIPDEQGRREILEVHTRGVPLASRVDLDDYAARTHGFVGADLETLVTEAGLNALERATARLETQRTAEYDDVLSELCVTIEDLDQALTEVEPSAIREHIVEVPSVT